MSLALVYCVRLALVVLGFVLKQVHGERVAVQAFKSFCFFDDLKANEPWGVQFQSDELPIRAILRSPTKVLFDGKPETYGSYSFKAETDGRYSVCFDNPSSTIQKISFNFLGQNANTEAETNAEKPDQIQLEIQDLNDGLSSVQREQDYMLRREEIHRQIAQRTNSRIRYWFAFQVILIAGSVAFEIYYLKRFFEKRRIV